MCFLKWAKKDVKFRKADEEVTFSTKYKCIQSLTTDGCAEKRGSFRPCAILAAPCLQPHATSAMLVSSEDVPFPQKTNKTVFFPKRG